MKTETWSYDHYDYATDHGRDGRKVCRVDVGGWGQSDMAAACGDAVRRRRTVAWIPIETGQTINQVREIGLLISSAPELLETLREATGFLKTGMGRSEILIRQCEVAIAKAGGA